MANKNCLVFETLGNIRDLELIKESNDGFMRLHGVFGVCGVKNNNNRVYNKKNYGMMVEALQREITEGSVLGELEHPTSMNIDLNKVSHKIESIEMNEDGTITGTIVLLDTAKGRDAQAIAKAAGSLYISSRGAGSIDESGNVNLTTIKTYDLVGTPGFSQAKLNLKKGQTLESLNESLEDGNIMYAIIDESSDADDLLADDNNKKEDDKKSDDKKSEENNSDDNSSDDDKDEKKEDKPSDNDKDDNKKNDKEDATMNDLKDAIEKLSDKIESLQADLHVAQESLNEKDAQIKQLQEQLEAIPSINYGAIEQWVTEEFATEFKESLTEEIMESVNETVEENVKSATEAIAEGVQNWTINEFAPLVEGYMTEEFAPVVEGWVTNEFAPIVEGWVTNEFAPVVESYMKDEFAPMIEGWINEELVPTIDTWINEECIPEHKNNIINEVNSNVSAFLESQAEDKLTSIDNLLEAIEKKGADNAAIELLEETKAEEKYAGVFVVEHMPAEFVPMWTMCSEAKQQEIIRSSRMYDFTKPGIMEKFWATVDFTEAKPVNEALAPESNYHNSIANQMRRLMKH